MSLRVGDIGKVFVSKKLAIRVKVVGLYRHIVTKENGVVFENINTVNLHWITAPFDWWVAQDFVEER